jgi:hypothetical protein
MAPPPLIEIRKTTFQILNNLYDMERKLAVHGDLANIQRNIERIKESFQTEKLFYEDPMGQSFSETRTDLEASISGSGTDALVVVEVIKPIIRCGDAAYSRVVQKGIVVVKSS